MLEILILLLTLVNDLPQKFSFPPLRLDKNSVYPGGDWSRAAGDSGPYGILPSESVGADMIRPRQNRDRLNERDGPGFYEKF